MFIDVDVDEDEDVERLVLLSLLDDETNLLYRRC